MNLVGVVKNKQHKRHQNNKFLNRKYVFESDIYIDFLKDKYIDKLPYQRTEKIIYCFWTGDNEMTPNRIEALKSIRENSGVKVQLITKKNLDKYKKNTLYILYMSFYLQIINQII